MCVCVCVYICMYIYIYNFRLDVVQISLRTENIFVVRQTFASFQNGFFRSAVNNLYQLWNSYQTITAKYSVVNTLHHGARAVCSNQQLLEEEDHLQNILIENKYPIWALYRVRMKIKTPSSSDQNKRNNTSANNTSGNKKPYRVLPYVKGLSESMKNVCSKHGVQVHYKGENTIKAS